MLLEYVVQVNAGIAPAPIWWQRGAIAVTTAVGIAGPDLVIAEIAASAGAKYSDEYEAVKNAILCA
jgi:hypothetical protein